MDIRINQGYSITSSIHVGEAEYVLGVNAKAPNPFVTWKCSDSKDYYWGHYFSDRFAAEKDLVARAQEEIAYLEQRNEGLGKPKTIKDRGRER